MKELIIGGKTFKNRLFIGTGKFGSEYQFKETLASSEAELVTVALTRVNEKEPNKDNILSAIDTNKVTVMLNTAGARNADEAVHIAHIGKAAGYNWIKLEIHPDAQYLLPDPVETLKAVEILSKEGMVVLPYINADPVIAHRLANAGAAAVMPLGSLIGSNRGIQTAEMISIIVEQSKVPVIVDAGIGIPSHAAQAIELGADAVLINTAIATAKYPAKMAEAFKLAIIAAEKGVDAHPSPSYTTANPTSPLLFDFLKD